MNQFPWPLAIRLEVLPGKTILEKFLNAAHFGFDAVELPGRFLSEYHQELIACKNDLPIPISSISLGFRGSLLSMDQSDRSICRQDIKNLLSLCADWGAVGLVMPPILFVDKHPRLTDPQPWSNLIQAQDALLLSQLPELVDHAEAKGVLLLLEPVNRSETDYLTSMYHGAEVCGCINRAGLALTADWFHMNLEESNPTETLRRTARWIRHVHIGGDNRTEPRPGSFDNYSLFNILYEMKYQGFIVAECRSLSGPADQVLSQSSRYLRELFKKIAEESNAHGDFK
ncbi:MAG: sugar phosphate isomerase/epimerase family protein [Phycisphaerae bacterium]